MFKSARASSFLSARCLRAGGSHGVLPSPRRRPFTTNRVAPLYSSRVLREQDPGKKAADKTEEAEQGAMSRRLSELSETNLEEGGRSAVKAVEEAGFDEELKQRLLDRIADAKFKTENQSALALANLPASAGKDAREAAAAKPWSGTEPLEDAVLRMLNDAHKPIKRTAKIPSPFRPPKKVDTGRPRQAPSSGVRLANARDRSSVYTSLKDSPTSEQEKEQFRKEMKERFSPGARALPFTLQGLASLANERIEDAIARGQFKNLPRGKKIERDHNMSSPFLDTTEYFMNKIIQKQEIVPPWIERQQELVSTAGKFRSRLRADWRRHAARLISSRGGSLEAQVRRAEEFAIAEAAVNPSAKRQETLSSVNSEGHMSQITLTGKLLPPSKGESETSIKISVTEDQAPETSPGKENEQPRRESSVDQLPETTEDQAPPAGGRFVIFRDSKWEDTERAYHKAAIENLNSMTRSYNLMAPNAAKRPYFSLERELRSCFADVAPQVPKEIMDRANAPKVKIELAGRAPGGVLENFGGRKATVYDERRPQYGFKEFWRDLFGSREAQ